MATVWARWGSAVIRVENVVAILQQRYLRVKIEEGLRVVIIGTVDGMLCAALSLFQGLLLERQMLIGEEGDQTARSK